MRLKKLAATILTGAMVGVTMLTGFVSATVSAEAATTNYNVVFPVNNGKKISYAYGYSAKYGGNHSGIDISNYSDNTVYSAVTGTVTAVANSCGHISIARKCEHYGTYGNMIVVRSTSGSTNGMYFYYGHLKQGSLKVKKGDKVVAGQAIAAIGSSGFSTGYHLHFEVRRGDNKTKVNVNPSSQGGSMVYANGPYAKGTSNTNNTNIKWSNELKDGQKYYISPKCAPNYSLGVAGNSNKNKANVCLVNKNAASSVWVAHKYGDYWYFTNKYTGKALDIYGYSAGAKQNIQSYAVNKNATQLFRLATNGKGYLALVSKSNGNVCVDTYGYNNFKAGTNIWCYTLDKSLNNSTQIFKFTEVK